MVSAIKKAQHIWLGFKSNFLLWVYCVTTNFLLTELPLAATFAK